MMDRDVATNSGYGHEAFVRGLSYFHWFQDVEVEVEKWQKFGEHALVARTRTEMTITKRTLLSIFPHLCSFGNEERNRDLTEKLLDRRVVMRGPTRFECDGAGVA